MTTPTIAARALEAILRVGTDPDQRFRWLRDFVRRDLPDAAVFDTYWEAVAFLTTAPFQDKPISVTDWERFRKEIRRSRLTPSRPSLLRLQRRVRRALDEFRRTRRLRLPFRVSEGWWLESGPLLPLAGGDPVQRFHAAVHALINVLGSRLVVCQNPRCRDLFIKTGRRAYCSSRCAQRVHTARFREAHPEKRRRQAPEALAATP